MNRLRAVTKLFLDLRLEFYRLSLSAFIKIILITAACATTIILIYFSRHIDQTLDESCIQTKYISSEWELMWLQNITDWQDGHICQALIEQRDYVNAFMRDTCTSEVHNKWCEIDDSVHRFWYHINTSKISTQMPDDMKTVELNVPLAIQPRNSTIWSYFLHHDVCLNEMKKEYIEPLISHLRHPLGGCEALFGYRREFFLFDRSYVLPKVNPDKKHYLFDAGASRWNEGAGGPSLSYFTQVWHRYGIDFDRIEAWEGATENNVFYATVPEEWKNVTHFHSQFVTDTSAKQPFIPSIIRKMTKKTDYVVFKLDIDSGGNQFETRIVDHLMADTNEDIEWIDEIVWEHHVVNQYMAKNWKKSVDLSMKINDSYQYFLKLRQRGIRAHSWV